ncbi:MAG: N-acetylneuraminate synthase family protein [Anaerolineales bacterium]|nr:N-acetylneuraminate synthase family protein [Anaerolineales bacterium]
MTIQPIQVGSRRIGPGQPVFIIAEVAQAHDGSLNLAHAYIDSVADAGADAVKFQTHIAEAESTPGEPFRKSSEWVSESRADYWQRTGFDPVQWQQLADHAAQRGLVFLSSPFSPEAVDLLEAVGVPAWKIASGEVTNLPMLERIAATGKPVLLSAGMSGWDEQDKAVAYFKEKGLPLALFQCATAYPSPPEEIGLNLMAEMRQRYQTPVGLSDHSGVIYSALAAAAQGAAMLEVHVTFSKQMPGADVAASLTIEELSQMVQGARFIEKMLASPVDKDQIPDQRAQLRQVFLHSLVARHDLKKGAVLRAEDLASKKPGSGISADRLPEVVGRKLARDVKQDELLSEEDLA